MQSDKANYIECVSGTAIVKLVTRGEAFRIAAKPRVGTRDVILDTIVDRDRTPRN